MKMGKREVEIADTSQGRRHAAGYALLIMMMMVTLLLVAMTAALPSIYTEAQREKEEELVFRGNEYARAIAAFHQQFNRYPSSVNELLKKTNGRRFLRHAYTDPMTRSGKWRFIHSDGQGVLYDSLTRQVSVASRVAAGGGPGATSGMIPGAGAGIGQSQTSGMSGGTSTSQSDDAKKKEDQTEKLAEQIRKACAQADTSSGSSSSDSAGGQSVGGGAYIAGVASCSHKESIRVRDGKSNYEEWEFLGVVVAANPAPPGVQPGTQPGGQPAAGGAAAGTAGGTGGSTTQPTTPPQAGPQTPDMPPLTDQSNQSDESDQPEPEEPQR